MIFLIIPFLTDFIEKHEYTVEEKLVNLFDLMCTTKILTIDKRLIDIVLKKGVFSKEELEVPFEDIETIGGYVILAKELPKPEEAEEEVEAQKVEVEKEE